MKVSGSLESWWLEKSVSNIWSIWLEMSVTSGPSDWKCWLYFAIFDNIIWIIRVLIMDREFREIYRYIDLNWNHCRFTIISDGLRTGFRLGTLAFILSLRVISSSISDHLPRWSWHIKWKGKFTRFCFYIYRNLFSGSDRLISSAAYHNLINHILLWEVQEEKQEQTSPQTAISTRSTATSGQLLRWDRWLEHE